MIDISNCDAVRIIERDLKPEFRSHIDEVQVSFIAIQPTRKSFNLKIIRDCPAANTKQIEIAIKIHIEQSYSSAQSFDHRIVASRATGMVGEIHPGLSSDVFKPVGVCRFGWLRVTYQIQIMKGVIQRGIHGDFR